MKMLQNSAQTLPMWIGNVGEKPPPLCGAVPPEPNYIGKVFESSFYVYFIWKPRNRNIRFY